MTEPNWSSARPTAALPWDWNIPAEVLREETIKVYVTERRAYRKDARSGNPAKRLPALAALELINKKLTELYVEKEEQ